MKSLILYCSEYKKNTEKIAKILADEIDSDLMNIRDLGEVDVKKYDLIGFGSGVYKEAMSPKIFKVAEQLNLKGQNVFVFSTNGVGMKFYNNKLIKLLESKGAIVKGGFACKGSFVAREFSNNKMFDILGNLSQGHPNEKDFKAAKQFIKKVVGSL